ncbi:DapH/DapD/GlmU-related protein [Spirosoma luteolum]
MLGIRLRYPQVQIGKGVRVYGPIQLRIARTARVVIQDNVVFRSTTRHNFVGLTKPVSICVLANAELLIGANSGFSGTSIYAATSIRIGNYSNFGGNSCLWDTDFHPLEAHLRRDPVNPARQAPIWIGSDVFVGANTLILKGITIGDRSVIGAGSVVTRPVPADEIWAGNPARYVRSLQPDPMGTGPHKPAVSYS